jgi:ribonuclease BN (tRNA processing enzyme)
MKLLLLGTGGYHPSETRETACLMLPELGLLLDAGTAMYRAGEHLATDRLDIFLSHAHLDHVIGLTYLFDVLHGKPVERVAVHGTAAALEAVEQHLFAPALFPIRPSFETRALRGEAALPQGGRLTHFPLEHPGGATGFRLDWPGHSLAYVTDTTARPDAAYLEHIRGVDLLVHECYFNDELADKAELTGHSCVTPTAELARAAGVGRLILTHINPLAPADAPLDLARAQAIFPAAELGRDRLEIEF